MTRTAGGYRGPTRTRAVVDWEVADLRDESAYPGSCGMSVNRCHTADRAEFRRRLLSGHLFQDSLNDVRAHALADNERIRRILTASNGVLVERDGPVMVYDVDIRSRRNHENLAELGKMCRDEGVRARLAPPKAL